MGDDAFGNAFGDLCCGPKPEAPATNERRLEDAARLVLYVALLSYFKEFLRQEPRWKTTPGTLSLHNHGIVFVRFILCAEKCAELLGEITDGMGRLSEDATKILGGLLSLVSRSDCAPVEDGFSFRQDAAQESVVAFEHWLRAQRFQGIHCKNEASVEDAREAQRTTGKTLLLFAVENMAVGTDLPFLSWELMANMQNSGSYITQAVSRPLTKTREIPAKCGPQLVVALENDLDRFAWVGEEKAQKKNGDEDTDSDWEEKELVVPFAPPQKMRKFLEGRCPLRVLKRTPAKRSKEAASQPAAKRPRIGDAPEEESFPLTDFLEWMRATDLVNFVEKEEAPFMLALRAEHAAEVEKYAGGTLTNEAFVGHNKGRIRIYKARAKEMVETFPPQRFDGIVSLPQVRNVRAMLRKLGKFIASIKADMSLTSDSYPKPVEEEADE